MTAARAVTRALHALLCALAVAGLFVPAAFPQQPASPLPVAPPPRNPQGIEPGVINVPYQETVTMEMPGVTRVLSVNPAIVEAALLSPGIVQLRALAFGQTFLHAWSPTGRATRTLQVIQPLPTQPSLAQQMRRERAQQEHLTFEYQNRYRTIRRGPRLSDTDLSTTNQLTHDLSSQMQTPYGKASGHVGYQRIDHVHELSTWTAALTDGHLGPIERLSVIGGDSTVGFSDFSLPTGTIRGIDVRYEGLSPYALEVLHGRRRLGFGASSLGAGLSSGEDHASLSGIRLRETRRPVEWGLAYATASGTGRGDMQTNQAVEASSWYWPSETLGFGAELGRNNEAAHGMRVSSRLRGGAFNMDAVYRNLSQRFVNLLGQSAEQGERGMRISSQWAPWHPLRLRQAIDVYQDTLFTNPDEPTRYNQELDLGVELDVTDSTLVTTDYGRQRFLGRLFPTDTTTVSAGLRQRLGAWPLIGNGAVFSDYLYRDLRSVNSPSSDFNSHTIRVGIGAPIARVLSWQLAQQWSFLEDELTGASSIPRETTVGLNYFQQFEHVPLRLRSGINYSTASSAGSANSFLTEEDRWILDFGARYDVTRDANLFLDSRLLRRDRREGRDLEIELETGMRYFFDTGISWEPSAKISGIVFQDMNGDGAQQTGEPGLPKVAVTADPEKRAVTDAGGRFYLGTIRGKLAAITVDLSTTPHGFVPTTPSAVEIDLTAPPKRPLAFGFVAQSELRIRVFVDGNGNSRYDATDAPLENVRVMLDGEQTTATDRSGWVFFRGMAPGAHRVSLTVDDLDPGLLPMTPIARDVALREGQAEIVDFPIGAERSVAGRVYVDQNRNAQFDSGEQALSEVPVCFNADDRRVQTREDGRYLFKGVPAGVHRVRVNCGATLRGYLPLNATVQVVELPVRAATLERIDFRLSEEAVMMQDITADVLRARRQEQALIEEMIESRRKAGQKLGTPSEIGDSH